MNIKRLMERTAVRATAAAARARPADENQRADTEKRSRSAIAKKKVIKWRNQNRRRMPAPGKGEKKEGTGKRKKTFKKRGEKRIVHHGLAISASFNNVVTITDTKATSCGRAPAASASRVRAQGDALRGDAGCSTPATRRRPPACARLTSA
jgi:hypothetical protein